MAARTLPCDPVVIIAAGFASQNNINVLKKRGLGYLINTTRSSCILNDENIVKPTIPLGMAC